jgi:hypothetical protein
MGWKGKQVGEDANSMGTVSREESTARAQYNDVGQGKKERESKSEKSKRARNKKYNWNMNERTTKFV